MATWKIKQGMTAIKIDTITELAKRLHLNRQTLNRKINYPRTFTMCEIQDMAKLFNWSDEELGSFIRAI